MPRLLHNPLLAAGRRSWEEEGRRDEGGGRKGVGDYRLINESKKAGLRFYHSKH